MRDGKRIFVSSGDDNHNRKDDSFGSFVMVEADELKYSNIIDGLLGGNFYTSTGPTIAEINVEGNTVTVKCSDAKSIFYSTRGRRCGFVTADKGDNVNTATFEISDGDGYFRISVVDEFGNRADSQAYFLDEI